MNRAPASPRSQPFGEGLDMVPKEWIGRHVVLELNMPIPMPQSEIVGAAGQSAGAMGFGWPQIDGILLADYPNGIVISTKQWPFGKSIIKGQVFSIAPLEGQSGGMLVT